MQSVQEIEKGRDTIIMTFTTKALLPLQEPLTVYNEEYKCHSNLPPLPRTANTCRGKFTLCSQKSVYSKDERDR